MTNPFLKHGLAALLVCVPALVFVGAQAHAQSKDFRTPFRLKVGGYFPSDGSLGYVAELDVNMPLVGLKGLYFTAGYSEFSEDGKRMRIIPLTANYLFPLPNPFASSTGNLYFGAGAGLYLLRAGGQSKETLGGFGMVGYNFNDEKTFLELKYHIATSVAGVSPNGLALMLGRKL